MWQSSANTLVHRMENTTFLEPSTLDQAQLTAQKQDSQMPTANDQESEDDEEENQDVEQGTSKTGEQHEEDLDGFRTEDEVDEIDGNEVQNDQDEVQNGENMVGVEKS